MADRSAGTGRNKPTWDLGRRPRSLSFDRAASEDAKERRSWFGTIRRPSLPGYLKPERGRRLKGIDEFEKPEFVGRMSRVEQRRKLAWYAMLASAVALGGAIGLALF